MIITNAPADVTPHAGTAACASMTPTATGVPGNSPVNCGNPAFAQLQARFTFQGACGVSTISRVRTQTVNGSDVKTSGVDFLVNYDVLSN